MIFSLRRSISLTGLKAFAISALMLVTTHVQPIQAIEMEFAAPGFSFKPKEVLIPNDKNDQDQLVVAAPLVISDGRIFVADTNNTLFEYGKDLELVKQWSLPGGSLSPPVMIDDEQLFIAGLKNLAILNVRTHKYSLRKALPPQAVVAASPSVYKNPDGEIKILLPSGDKRVYVLSTDLEVLDSIAVNALMNRSAVILDGKRFVVHAINGRLWFCNFDGSGFCRELGGNAQTAPILFNNKIYSFMENGVLNIHEISGAESKTIYWRYRFLATPIHVGSHLRVYDESAGVLEIDEAGNFLELNRDRSHDPRIPQIQMLSRMQVHAGAQIHGTIMNDGYVRIYDAESGKMVGFFNADNRITSDILAAGNSIVFAVCKADRCGLVKVTVEK